jgi:flagellar protein FliT
MMMSSQDTLSIYDEMTVLSGQMLRAASVGDWDLLVELERECAARVDRLRQHDRTVLETAERGRKAAAIRAILANDRQIRDLTQPWMAKLAAMINTTSTERRIARAYGI